uniref:Fibrinogen C-terminal domain-containing protein n=1 Tax=Anopheles farauti TaxID=69004 RepID=A0A182QXC8_9DIPT
MTIAESRILEQISQLSQNVSYEIKSLNDQINGLKVDINGIKVQLNDSLKQVAPISANHAETLENNDKPLNLAKDSILQAIGQLLVNFTKQFHNISTASAQRFATLEHRLDRLPEDTGVYFMQPDPGTNFTFEVSRDWTNNHGFGGNWIVFQRQFNGSVNFFRNWTEYKRGFGELRGEHWLGLDKLHAIVSTRQHELLIVMEDFDGVVAYAHYDDFSIGGESEKYVLKTVGQYTGTAGDSFSRHKDERFSTYDQDNDKHDSNCAKWVSGAWWFYKCHHRFVQ